LILDDFMRAYLDLGRIIWFDWIQETTWHERKRRLANGSLKLALPVTDLKEIKVKVLLFGAESGATAGLRTLVAEDAERIPALYVRGG